MNLAVSIRQIRDVSILDAAGRITIGESATTLRETIRTMAKEGRTKILINLAETTHLDSAGLGALVYGFVAITKQGGQLKLANLTKRVSNLLLVTKLCTVFEVFEDEAAAIDSFTAAPSETSNAAG